MKKSFLTALLLVGAFLRNATMVGASAQNASSVKASVYSNRAARLQNGVLDVKIDKSGKVYYMAYNGRNVLSQGGSFYFSAQEDRGVELYPTKVELKTANADYAEIVYTNDTARIWKQQGFILKKGESKLYTYVTIKGTDRQNCLEEARMTYRLGNDFIDGYVGDDRQGLMPTVAQMNALTDDDKLQDATFKMADGSIYTKYDWAEYTARDLVHGAMDTTHTTGIWALQPSAEYVNGGPLRQDLTVHMDTRSPVVCQYFHSGHFGACGKQTIDSGFVKMFGPMAIYVNSGSREEMIADAKAVAEAEAMAWPYKWFTADDYPTERSTVSGRVRLTNYDASEAEGLEVVLSEPGVDPYMQYRGYSFWTTTSADGSFTMANVRPGNYSLFVYANRGEITETLERKDIAIATGENNLGDISWTPTRHSTLLWRIGESDRTSDGFCLSDSERRYANFTLPPANIDFRPGESNEKTDWWYAQTKKGAWNIIFNLDEKPVSQCFFTASVAAASKEARVVIKVNGRTIATRTLDSNDGAIYRSAMRSGRHSLHMIKMPASVFKAGENTLTLQMDNETNGGGVMWDCLKLETGTTVTNSIVDVASDGDETHALHSLSGVKTSRPARGIYILNGKKYIIK